MSDDGLTWETWKRCFAALFLLYAALAVLAAFGYVAWHLASAWVAAELADALRELVI